MSDQNENLIRHFQILLDIFSIQANTSFLIWTFPSHSFKKTDIFCLDKISSLVWKVYIAQPRYRTYHFDAFYIFTIKIFEISVAQFSNFPVRYPTNLVRQIVIWSDHYFRLCYTAKNAEPAAQQN
jgi:hypothetical protein